MTLANREPIKHHYVPQFYLEHWSGPDGKLCVTRRIGERLLESRLAPKSTAFEERLYSFKDEPLSANPEPNVIETRVLQAVDNDGARAHRRLLEQGPTGLTEMERRAWALFINAMFERDPQHIHSNESTARQIAEQVLKDVLDEAPDDEHRDRLRQAASLMDISAGTSNMVLRGMVAEIHKRNVLEYFEGMWWVVFDMPPGLELHTSTRPLVVNAGRSRTPIDVAWMPLSPTKLFALFPQSWLPQDGTQISQEVEDLFRMIAAGHNLLLLSERPERLFSTRPISEPERRAAQLHLRNSEH